MKIGKLRHRVTVQESTRVNDSMGGGREEWSDLFSAWANVKPIKGERRYEAMQVKGGITHEIEMRYRPGITVHHRIVYDGRIFEIVNVYPDEIKTMLTIECSEVV
jgi:SPP1 family predicted phage head-tail adaptor